jgi:hypothetical protein
MAGLMAQTRSASPQETEVFPEAEHNQGDGADQTEITTDLPPNEDEIEIDPPPEADDTESTETDIVPSETGTVSTENPNIPPWQTGAQLLKRAADSLRRLEGAIKKDGFASARVALNIWRTNAADAGIFDPVKYDAFKKEIYQKSIEETLAWFSLSAEQLWIDDAAFWCRVYSVRANEIGDFDPAKYDEMQAKIQHIKILKEKKRKKS